MKPLRDFSVGVIQVAPSNFKQLLFGRFSLVWVRGCLQRGDAGCRYPTVQCWQLMDISCLQKAGLMLRLGAVRTTIVTILEGLRSWKREMILSEMFNAIHRTMWENFPPLFADYLWGNTFSFRVFGEQLAFIKFGDRNRVDLIIY